ncbi:MAG TPA: glycogen debranching protein, partial [Flavisolibacter sp.]|nr:glycogen debranching protein [Flavisolibacter sp.]
AYLADVLGWHDRARTHFNAYALSQVTDPLTGPVEMDTALHLARHAEKMGTSVFSSGYISRNPGGDKRPHHYDMNLVFIDQLLNHFLWTGDTAYVKTMWPLLKRHLDWEDRNFDVDGDNLYDAYAAIWASDALQYSGGGVTHSSAYNYKAFSTAADLAKIVGEDPGPYRKKADAILQAINTKLWMPHKGVYAEFKDLLGKQLLHPSPGLWTIYHAIDSKVPDAFKAYQSLRWIDNNIPHIPILAKGFADTSLYTISTTNWQPYTWSLNNVVLGEVMHTALAYWQGGRSKEAFKLFKGSLVESMYLGASPGNFQQLSFYDAVRGELYRDFADDVGTTARSLVEGLFGVFVDALHDTICIKPGFPSEWKQASLSTPDFNYSYHQSGRQDRLTISTNIPKKLALSLLIRARAGDVENVLVNGKAAKWYFDSTAIEVPRLQVLASAAKAFKVEIRWKGKSIGHSIKKTNPDKQATITFHRAKHGKAVYWQPVLQYSNTGETLPKRNANSTNGAFEKIDLTPYFNDQVTNIFKNQYLSPRPKGPTLQLPTQGIGNWAYPLVMPNISDSGLRARSGTRNEFTTKQGVPFATPSQHGAKNILFTSQWDNYPDSAIVPLTGNASHVYFLLAGSTNPMQSRMVNGEVVVQYKDGSEEKLELKNPENWWPIEQDYYEDGFAFTTDAPKPVRVYLKTGEDTREFKNYTSLRGFSSRAIDGGAGTILDLPLDPAKELQSLTLKAVANDVVIGLMSITLVR